MFRSQPQEASSPALRAGETHDEPFRHPQFAAAYDEWLETAYGRAAAALETDMIERLLAPLCPGAKVLEIGCGTAWMARALIARGFRVTGTDRSAAMLGVARGRAPIVLGDAQRLPFGDETFDAAFLVAVAEFVSDPVELFREARRVARRRVVVVAIARGSYLAFRRRLAARRGHPVFRRASFRTRDEWVRLAREAGAEPETVGGALFLPPAFTARAVGIERWLSRHLLAGAGLVGLALPGSQSLER